MTDWEDPNPPRRPALADVVKIRDGLDADTSMEQALLLRFALAAMGREVLKPLAEHALLLSQLDPESDTANQLADTLATAIGLCVDLDDEVPK